MSATRFGEIATATPQLPGQDQAFSPELVTDVTSAYRFSPAVRRQIGINFSACTPAASAIRG